MRSEARTAALLGAALLTAWLLLFHTTFLVPDSSGTYAWGRSLLYDRDVDFRNELDRLGWIEGDSRVRFHATTDGGRPGNPFGMGSGILWMPFLLAADGVLALGGGAPTPRGYTDLHVLAASTGTAVYGLAALLLGWRVARRYAPQAEARTATLALGLGTPFLAYAVHLPTYAHVNAAFTAAVVLSASLWARDAPLPWRWALAGAAVGAAGLVRAQGVVLLAIPLVLWADRARGGGRRGRIGGAALLGGFAAVFSLQIVAWLRIYGSLQVPQGGGFLDLLRPHLLGVLLSPWHGLLPWAPVLILVIPGLAVLWRKDRPLALGAAAAALGQIWLVASVPDWWGGYALGARRLVDLTPVFLLAAAPGLSWLRDRAGSAVAHGGAVIASLWSLLLMVRVRSGGLSAFREISWGDLLQGQGTALLHLPSYLWQQATTSRWAIHTVVHRDSPVQPQLDSAANWMFPVALGLCWAAGLAAMLALQRWGDRRAG